MPDTTRRQIIVRCAAGAALLTLLSACGNGGGGAAAPAPPPPVAPPAGPPVVTLQAGLQGGYGIVDGAGIAARFNEITDIAADGAGNYYVADQDATRRTVRKVSSAGVVSTVYSNTDPLDPFPPINQVAMNGRNAVAVASDGNVFLLETVPGKRLTRLAADGSASVVLSGEAALGPTGALAAGPNGTIYLIGRYSIRQRSASGAVTLLAGDDNYPGWLNTDGQGAAARFSPIDLAKTDRQGNLLVYSGGVLRRVTPAGLVSTLPVQLGLNDGVHALAFGADNSVYLLTRRILDEFKVRKLAPDYSLSEVISGPIRWGWSRDDNPPGSPQQLASGSDGKLLLVARRDLHQVAGGVRLTFAGLQNSWHIDVDGQGTAARFASPFLLAGDRNGNAYVADNPANYANGHTGETAGLTLRKVAPDGSVSTLARDPALRTINAIVVDQAGTIYVSEAPHTQGLTTMAGGAVYRVTADGKTVRLAGESAIYGYRPQQPQVDGAGSVARFNSVRLLGTDADGNLYASDSPVAPYRKIAPDGSTTSLATLPASVGLAPDGLRYELTDSGVARLNADGSRTEVFNWSALPAGATKPRAIAATGVNSFALLSGETVLKLVLPR